MSDDAHIDPHSKGIAAEMEALHQLEGEAYWKQLKSISERKEFKLVEKDIFSAAGQTDPDYPRLLDVAKKAVAQGYQVYILPNPKTIRSADLILQRKGFYRMYDVKTIYSGGAIRGRLLESANQTDRVILSIKARVNPRFLANDLKFYFENIDKAKEVLVFKGGKVIVVSRATALSKGFQVRFRKAYIK